jgi:pimeloyl-ACP methyl ester carboxylesterase
MTPAIDALAQRCRVVTFSLCDEPTSGYPYDAGRGVENYFGQIEDALNRAKLEQAVIVGVSYTGPVATEFTLRCPDRVKALVLASALPTDWVPNARARFYTSAPLLFSPIFMLDAPLRAMREIRAAFPRLPARARFSAGQARRVLRWYVSPRRMAERLRWNEQFAFSDPSSIDRPVLVITGEDGLDRVVPPELTRRYLDCLPHARHEVLPRTGHLGLLTRPAEFAELIVRFADEAWNDARRISA